MASKHDVILKIREDLSSSVRMSLWLSCCGLILLVWVLLTWGPVESRWFSPLILPSPGDVLRAFGPLHWDMGLTRAIVASLVRVTIGFAIAAAVAVPLGIAMGTFTKIGAFFEPIALFGGYIPVVTLIPLTIAWFKLGEYQKVGFLVIGIFVFLLPLVIKEIASVDDVYLQTGYTLGANRWQSVRHVIVPVAMSKIFAHMRMLYGVGWGYIILAEMTELDSPGLGALISLSQRRSMTDRVFAVLFVIVLIAIVVDQMLKRLGYMLFPYEEEI